MDYQVSYLIQSENEKGEIVMRDAPPEVGDIVTIRGRQYEVVEVEPLILPLSEFAYFHALCEPLAD